MNQEFRFNRDQKVYHGKVRDVYSWEDRVVMVASNRISAFDHILPKPIPYKGQVLNLIAAHFLKASARVVPNWLEAVPHPKVSIGKKCEPIRLEMVVRGYLAGHAWRTYKSGERTLCGIVMPEGMKEADRFEKPIITPATKADEGHDEDISEEQILLQEIVDEHTWDMLKEYSLGLFSLGTKMAAEQGLLLVDTKYEFGIYNGQIVLIDEVHTPDSSRYYVADGYEERQASEEKQMQLSKEFVREWLMENGFQGLEGQTMPEMPDEFVEEVSNRYIDLYEQITGKTFSKNPYSETDQSIQNSVDEFFNY